MSNEELEQKVYYDEGLLHELSKADSVALEVRGSRLTNNEIYSFIEEYFEIDRKEFHV